MMELDNCPCSGANLPRFVQPVILAVLSSGPLHGYLVVQRLAETSLFRKQPPDATGVYRSRRVCWSRTGSLRTAVRPAGGTR